MTWTAPTDDGGSSDHGYTVTSTPGNKTATAAGTATSAVVTGLTNGTSYTFTVQATNTAGTGPASAPSNAMTPALPRSHSPSRSPIPQQAHDRVAIHGDRRRPAPGLTVSLTSSTPAVCTVSGFLITFLTRGDVLHHRHPAWQRLVPARAPPVTRAFTVSKVNQSIFFTSPGNKTMPSRRSASRATAAPGMPVTVTSTTPPSAPSSGFEVTLLIAGTCTLSATQPGNNVYNAATTVTRSFTVNKVNQTIAFTDPGNKTMVQSPFPVSATARPVGPAGRGYLDDLPGLHGRRLRHHAHAPGHLLARGQPGRQRHLRRGPDRLHGRSRSPRSTQSITFANPGNKTSLQSPLTVTPTATSGLSVTLASTTTRLHRRRRPGHARRRGTCSITANQAGDAVYAAANGHALVQRHQGPADHHVPDPGPQSMLSPEGRRQRLGVVGPAGHAVVVTTTICTIAGDVVTLKKAGTCTIKGRPGRQRHLRAAPAVTRHSR